MPEGLTGLRVGGACLPIPSTTEIPRPCLPGVVQCLRPHLAAHRVANASLFAGALGSPSIHSWDSSRKLGTQIGLLDDTVLAPYDRKEIPLRLYLQILALDIAEAHHAPV